MIFAWTLCTVFIGANAICHLETAEQGGIPGIIHLCRNPRKTDCIAQRSHNSCIDLYVAHYLSGFVNGTYKCTIYNRTNCRTSGNYTTLDRGGYDLFPFIPMSFRCPCLYDDEFAYNQVVN